MVKSRSQLDATIDIVTPENIAFQYRVAGPFRRLPAFVLDLLLRIGIFSLCGIAAAVIGSYVRPLAGLLSGAQLIGWFVLDWFYGGLFETYMNGQTPGKMIMRIRVLTTDGQPISGMQAVMRNVFRYADFWPLLSVQAFSWLSPELVDYPVYVIPTGLLGLASMMMNRRYQRIGDLVCGTMVVAEERHWLSGVAQLDDPRAAQLAAYIPADYQVSRSLARTLADYVDRRRFFSRPRRQEVARHLGEPLVEEFALPADTSHDLLLCALYYRTFVADRGQLQAEESPFAQTSGPPAADDSQTQSEPLIINS
jgi:uncharacterized RDD family membrane protein YckC